MSAIGNFSVNKQNDDGDGVTNEQSNYPIFVAKFDYTSRTEDDLGFMKGDKLYIVDDSNADWWLAMDSSNEKGFIPSNYVIEFQSLEVQEYM